eukprot:TRINITY_DN23422_c0_g2_i1.p1 TRINITY_DN23422_c0_g2~~TRINITY_DN23422_c0_g2_i1.p1  ORF type:complete len:806 (-),score=136.36 TRINITY_DN23422_c0_g2_i1:20-2437(-)
MLLTGPPQSARAICVPYKSEGNSLTHVSQSRTNNLLFVCGQKVVQALELKWESVGGDNEDQYTFLFKRRGRNLHNSLLRRESRNYAQCKGVVADPKREGIAASSWSNGEVTVFDATAPDNSKPLISRWQVSKSKQGSQVQAMAWIPGSTGQEEEPALLACGSSDGTLSVWSLSQSIAEFQRAEECSSWNAERADETGAPGAAGSPGGAAAHPQIAARHSTSAVGASAQQEVEAPPPLQSQLHKAGAKTLDLQAQFVGDGEAQLLEAREDGRVNLFTLGAGRDLRDDRTQSFRISHKAVCSARFHPHMASCFAAAPQDSSVRVMDIRSSVVAAHIRTGMQVGRVRWRPDSEYHLATCGLPTTMGSEAIAGVLVWDLRKPFVPVYQIHGHDNFVEDFLWADNGHIVSCSRDNTVRLQSASKSHMPVSMMRLSATAWAFGRAASDRMALVAERWDPGESNHKEVIDPLALKSKLDHGGFEDDVRLLESANVNMHALRQELESQRRVQNAALLCNAPLGGALSGKSAGALWHGLPGLESCKGAGLSVSQRCHLRGEECLAAGQRARAHSWRLLAEVMDGYMDSPDGLLASVLNNPSSMQQLPQSPPPPKLRRPALNVEVPPLPGGNLDGLDDTLTFETEGPDDHAGGPFQAIRMLNFGDAPPGATSECPSPVGPRVVSKQALEKRRLRSLDLVQDWKYTWRQQTLRFVIDHYQELNDVEMLLSVVATFGVGPELVPAARAKITRWVQGACSVLSRLQAFEQRAALLRSPLAVDLRVGCRLQYQFLGVSFTLSLTRDFAPALFICTSVLA